MDHWDVDAIERMGPASIEFEPTGGGHLRFIAVEGLIDWRGGMDDGQARVEFTWEGDDDGDRVSGRGWVEIVGDDLRGRVFFHRGDVSRFRAIRGATLPGGGR